ncbi:MAG: hypothetical protein M1838_003611 [Thelocarpon superellum]|nr:MAG: hypothetical protein M1838_003611 [Thelocarpon superellum]
MESPDGDLKTNDQSRREPGMRVPLFQSTLALASLSLATKSTESPRRLRELLLPAHRFLHSSNPAAPPLTLTSPLYAVLRATVVQAEMMLLRVLKFSIRMPIALHHLPRYLVRAIGDGDTVGGYDGLSEDHKDEYKIGALMDTALARAVTATTVNAYKDYHLANFYPARAVAATCLYRVLQQRGLQVTDQDGKAEGWLDDVTGGKVEREEFDEILARLT